VAEGLQKDDSYTVPSLPITVPSPFRHTHCSAFRNPSVTPSATLIVMNISILGKKVAENRKKIKFLLKILCHFSTPAGMTCLNHRKGPYLFKKKIMPMSSVNQFDGFIKTCR
jgi:hypothetical protein